MAGDDADLVALIDGELDEIAESRLLARLAADDELRKRYQALRRTETPIAASLDTLVQKAPLPRLRAALALDDAHRVATRAVARIGLREIAAGIGACLLAAGLGAWIELSFAPRGEKQDWISAVEEYTNLYTNATFSSLNPDASLQAKELAAVGERVGAHLTPESVALPGLRFTVAFMLSYKGSPLGAIAYVDSAGEPVMLCVIADQAPDAPIHSEQRGELSLATWSRGGRGHLVVGRIPEERAAAFARTLEKLV
jgi:anti-sigma factor RsiW